MNTFVFTIPQRLVSVKIVLCLSLTLSLLFSYKLWLVPNHFAVIQLIEGLIIPDKLIALLGVFSCLCLIGALFFRLDRLLILTAFLINVVLTINNINLLQPWFIVYNFSLLIFCFYNGRVDDSNNFTSIFICLQLVVIAIYLFNGLTKINTDFVHQIFEPLLSSLKSIITERQFKFLLKLGALIPYTLLFIAITLSVRYMRYLAITLVSVMHIILLFLVFPSAKQPSVAFWFMNVVMLLLVYILFLGKTKQRYFNNTVLFQKGVFYFVVALFFILPIQCIITNSSKHFAFNFYSGKIENKLILTQNSYSNLPYYLRYFCKKNKNLFELDTQLWSKQALGIMHINEPFVTNKIEQFVRQQCEIGVKD